jgi:rifampicin phosphotransferase
MKKEERTMQLTLTEPGVNSTQKPSADLVLNLADTGATMLAQVGGKAANLGEMLRAGLPVPGGICLTTEAYRRVAATAGINFAALAAASPEDVTRLARDARRRILASPVPSEVVKAIVAGYAALGDSPVAVRSSATAEDLPHASFAGQQDTYLHVVGARAVFHAVRRCWASLWTERAIIYRNTNGIDHSAVRLAVVVQKMVDAKVAGVMFTANPVTGHRSQTVIDASPGLGEAVVSGAVNPDHFVVDSATGEIIEQRLGDKRVEVRSLPGGGVEYVKHDGSESRACLRVDQVRSLTELGQRVQAHYGSPQDTEWAVDTAGALWLTQARPITTLYPLPAGARPDDFRVYFNFSVAQGLYRPITPMGMSALRLVGSSAARVFGIPAPDPLAGPPVFAEAGGRLFIDLTSTMRGRVGRWLLPKMLDVMEARSAAVLRTLRDDPKLSLTRRSPWLFLGRALGIAIHYGAPLRMIEALARPQAAVSRIERINANLSTQLKANKNASPQERLNTVERILFMEVIQLGLRTMPAAAAGLGMLGLATRLLGDDAVAEDLHAILRGLPHNVTTEMDLQLWELACSMRADEAAREALATLSAEKLAWLFHQDDLPPALQRGLTNFLARWGHRAVAEIDLGMPRWSDDPAHILGVLSNYMRLEDLEFSPTAIFAKGVGISDSMVARLEARASRHSRIRGRLVRFALHRARQLSGLRETPKYLMVLALSAARRELAKVGERLSQHDSIQNADDIFFLTLEEARSALDGRDMKATVAARRQVYELEMRRRQLPRVLLSDGTEAAAPQTATGAEGSLTGTAASAGKVWGKARVVFDPVGAHLEPGEILVVPSTDPGWTPLFLTAGGLVMEMGGANSHGAVVAREYGIPAVVGVAGATQQIVTGQQICVDGSTGSVILQVASRDQVAYGKPLLPTE